ncbi:hypothetical protein KQX54_010170 [Cotesia glomerata]|uniref:Uncharacterized protein n=1 Tax=Cotesia glomerata TaxID=32391 RepID=A0AAV7J0F1_COTGL|nr:hypothetical protein KQX54_010170 [Cotesia glomerata]
MSDSIVNNDPNHSIVILGRVTGKYCTLLGINDQVKNYLFLKYSEPVIQCNRYEEESEISIKDLPMTVINHLAKLNYHIAFISGSPVPNHHLRFIYSNKLISKIS